MPRRDRDRRRTSPTLRDRLDQARGYRQGRVLRVDSPDQLFVTRGYVLTHNTPQYLVWAEERRPARRIVRSWS